MKSTNNKYKSKNKHFLHVYMHFIFIIITSKTQHQIKPKDPKLYLPACSSTYYKP